MSKPESEKAIRSLCTTWYGTLTAEEDKSDPSYSAFKQWAFDNNHSDLWKFRSRMPVDDVVEMWFDQKLKQTWRN